MLILQNYWIQVAYSDVARTVVKMKVDEQYLLNDFIKMIRSCYCQIIPQFWLCFDSFYMDHAMVWMHALQYKRQRHLHVTTISISNNAIILLT